MIRRLRRLRLAPLPLLAAAALLPAAAAARDVPLPVDAARAVDIVEDVLHNRPGSSYFQRKRGVESAEFELSEDEVNSAIGYYVAKDDLASRWIRSITVRYGEDKTFDVDALAGFGPELLEKVDPEAKGFIASTLAKLLRSQNKVHVEGFFTSAKGRGFLEIRKVRVNGIPVPDAVVEDCLELIGPRLRPPVDFHRLFVLGNGVEKVEILPGRVRLRVRALPGR